MEAVRHIKSTIFSSSEIQLPLRAVRAPAVWQVWQLPYQYLWIYAVKGHLVPILYLELAPPIFFCRCPPCLRVSQKSVWLILLWQFSDKTHKVFQVTLVWFFSEFNYLDATLVPQRDCGRKLWQLGSCQTQTNPWREPLVWRTRRGDENQSYQTRTCSSKNLGPQALHTFHLLSCIYG